MRKAVIVLLFTAVVFFWMLGWVLLVLGGGVAVSGVCEFAVKEQFLVRGQRCRLDHLLCFCFDKPDAVASCPVKRKLEAKK